MKKYNEYVKENCGWIQQEHTKNTASAITIEYQLLSKYITYLVQIGFDKEHIDVLTQYLGYVYRPVDFGEESRKRDYYLSQALRENIVNNINYLQRKY